MMNIRAVSIMLLIILTLLIGKVYALEKATHFELNGKIVDISGLDSCVKNIGFSGVGQTINGKNIKDWIQLGSQKEDEPMSRSRNHFHNPLLKSDQWGQAGLNSVLFTGMSSALWIQDQEHRRVTDLGGDWSWKKARQFYYAALTGDSSLLNGFTVEDGSFTTITGSINLSKAARDTFFAWTFRALGQTMHLVQDASVPAHTRNDVHILWNYENWVDELRSSGAGSFQNLFAVPQSFNGTVANIASFIDTDQYTGNNPADTVAFTFGLAEYSNANFFSEDTINLPGYGLSSVSFPYPNVGSTNLQSLLAGNAPLETIIAEDGVLDTGMWVKKTGDGELIDHIAKFGYTTNELAKIQGNDNTYSRTFILDDKCYEDYAFKLIPRAVGYSAGLLNYFFRGQIDMHSDRSSSGYVISNLSSEDMIGDFSLYYDDVSDNRILLSSWNLSIGANSQGIPIEFVPPDNAKDQCHYMLAFTGQMGQEQGAVAGNIITMPCNGSGNGNVNGNIISYSYNEYTRALSGISCESPTMMCGEKYILSYPCSMWNNGKNEGWLTCTDVPFDPCAVWYTMEDWATALATNPAVSCAYSCQVNFSQNCPSPSCNPNEQSCRDACETAFHNCRASCPDASTIPWRFVEEDCQVKHINYSWNISNGSINCSNQSYGTVIDSGIFSCTYAYGQPYTCSDPIGPDYYGGYYLPGVFWGSPETYFAYKELFKMPDVCNSH